MRGKSDAGASLSRMPSSRTLSAFTKLDRNTVIAVDEWGLLGTRQALELLRHQGAPRLFDRGPRR
jgi:hypothetical protein